MLSLLAEMDAEKSIVFLSSDDATMMDVKSNEEDEMSNQH
jgi:hypothetical protein